MPASVAVTARADVLERTFVSDSPSSPSRVVHSRPAAEAWLIAMMLFVLTAANGRPAWWNSAIPATLVSLCLIVMRGPAAVARHAISRVNAVIFWTLLLLAVWTGLSALATKDVEVGLTFVLRCVVPLVIYLA